MSHANAENMHIQEKHAGNGKVDEKSTRTKLARPKKIYKQEIRRKLLNE